jgi:hypothetical protein
MALQLAIKNIRPARVEIVEGYRPLSAAVEHQLRFRHDADQIVYVDADSLILSDMVPFLESNTRPYVDCYVTDRFRGRIHCGVHVTRADVVHAMSDLETPKNDKKYVLRPESRLRNLAMGKLGTRKEFRNFNILHDHFQYNREIFYKYALRELRSRTQYQRARLQEAMNSWTDSDLNQDIYVARMAIQHARSTVPLGASTQQISRYIKALPVTTRVELERAGIKEKGPFVESELEAWLERHPMNNYSTEGRPYIFGIGLSRTGTRSLTSALHVLGWDTIHYPADQRTFEQLCNADYNLDILQQYQGITDITVAPYFAQLDRQYPGAKFILTVRDRESWLRSCVNHWYERPAFAETSTPEQETYMNMRRLLRAAVFGCYTYNEERFSWAYDQHVRAVREHFKDRPHDFLEIDICAGAGWKPICDFLDQQLPIQPFPHKGSKLSKKLAQVVQHAEASAGGFNSTAPAAEALDSDVETSTHQPQASTRDA